MPMLPLHRTILVISGLVCGSCRVWRQRRHRLAWGSQGGADKDGFSTFLELNSTGPFDSAGNPILTVVHNFSDANLAAFLCGRKNPDSYPQTTFGPPVFTELGPPLCLTVFRLGAKNVTISLSYIDVIGTRYRTSIAYNFKYGIEFISKQSVLVDPSSSTDYIPTLVPARKNTGPYPWSSLGVSILMFKDGIFKMSTEMPDQA
ncbi:hypothetical protein K438DRAFT_1748030 [Mycena galopus ATCC 62051]|nr:hypothetical protein K438DRAFT_1748030 [Mycena galopus ATCC 62051]